MKYLSLLLFLAVLLLHGCSRHGFDNNPLSGSDALPADGAPADSDALVAGDGRSSPDAGPPQGACGASGWCWENPLPQGNTLYGVHGSGKTLFAVGEKGAVLRGDGSGWTPMSSGTTYKLSAVWTDGTEAFAVTGEYADMVLRYDGSAWWPLSSGKATYCNAVWGSSASDIWAVGAKGTILRYDGSAWAPVSSGTASALNGVWGSSASDVWAVGGGGPIVQGRFQSIFGASRQAQATRWP